MLRWSGNQGAEMDRRRPRILSEFLEHERDVRCRRLRQGYAPLLCLRHQRRTALLPARCGASYGALHGRPSGMRLQPGSLDRRNMLRLRLRRKTAVLLGLRHRLGDAKWPLCHMRGRLPASMRSQSMPAPALQRWLRQRVGNGARRMQALRRRRANSMRSRLQCRAGTKRRALHPVRQRRSASLRLRL